MGRWIRSRRLAATMERDRHAIDRADPDELRTAFDS